MNTVTLGVSSIDDVKGRLAAAFRDEPQGQRISFASVDLLWKVISPKRWDIIRAMTGQGPLAIREVARRLGRDVKGCTAICWRSSMPVWSIVRRTVSFFPMMPSTSISCSRPHNTIPISPSQSGHFEKAQLGTDFGKSRPRQRACRRYKYAVSINLHLREAYSHEPTTR